MRVNSGGEQRGESTGGQGWTLESSGGKKVRLRCGPEAQPRGPTGRRCPLLRAQLRGRRPQALTSEPREALGVGRGALLCIQSGTTTAPGRRTDLRASAWGPVLTRSPRGQAGWGVGHHRGRAGVRSEVLAGGGGGSSGSFSAAAPSGAGHFPTGLRAVGRASFPNQLLKPAPLFC